LGCGKKFPDVRTWVLGLGLGILVFRVGCGCVVFGLVFGVGNFPEFFRKKRGQ